MNPYYRSDFFSFLQILVQRFWLFCTGELGLQDLVSDEIQILVLAGVAVSSALVGCLLILRKMAMLANSLSHTILLGIIIAFILTRLGSTEAHGWRSEQSLNLGAMLLAAFLMGIVTTYLTELLVKVAKLQEDASNGLVFTSLFALGVILVTVYSRNAHIGTEIIMGNANLLHLNDLKLVAVVLGINVLVIWALFKEFAITTFDGGLAQSLGFSPGFFNYLLMTLVAATAIAAFRAVGFLMFLAFITGPPLTARLLTHSLKRMLFLSAAIGALSALLGVALARHIWSVQQMALTTGGLVVCCIVGIYVVALIAAPEQGLVAGWLARRRLAGQMKGG